MGQHFSFLQFTQNVIIDDALISMDSLLMIDDLDWEPTTEEFSKAIGMMAPQKTPDSGLVPRL